MKHKKLLHPSWISNFHQRFGTYPPHDTNLLATTPTHQLPNRWTTKQKNGLCWVHHPPTNSHHQDDITSLVGIPYKPLYATGILGGGLIPGLWHSPHITGVGIFIPLKNANKNNKTGPKCSLTPKSFKTGSPRLLAEAWQTGRGYADCIGGPLAKLHVQWLLVAWTQGGFQGDEPSTCFKALGETPPEKPISNISKVNTSFLMGGKLEIDRVKKSLWMVVVVLLIDINRP